MGGRSPISLCPAQVLSADGESTVAVLKEGSLFGEVNKHTKYSKYIQSYVIHNYVLLCIQLLMYSHNYGLVSTVTLYKYNYFLAVYCHMEISVCVSAWL